MLLKLFAGLSAAATALNISSPRVEFTGIKLAGFALLRFAEFYIGTFLAYIAAVYAYRGYGKATGKAVEVLAVEHE